MQMLGRVDDEELMVPSHQPDGDPQAILRLLKDPSLLDEHLANHLAPLLERLLKFYISEKARLVLHRLSVATIPLGKVALEVLCPRPILQRVARCLSAGGLYQSCAVIAYSCIDGSAATYARTA